MEKKDPLQPVVSILGSDNKEAAEIRRLVHNHGYPYRTEMYTTVPALTSGLATKPCMAAILDLDSVPLDNRAIRNLTLGFPSVCFLCASRNRFHPELKDAISYHLFACLTKPIDPDELHFFLKCIRDDFAREG